MHSEIALNLTMCTLRDRARSRCVYTLRLHSVSLGVLAECAQPHYVYLDSALSLTICIWIVRLVSPYVLVKCAQSDYVYFKSAVIFTVHCMYLESLRSLNISTVIGENAQFHYVY